MTRIAVLDDWQKLARQYADWAPLKARADVTFFDAPLGDADAVVDALADYDIVLSLQDRTKLPATVIERLPKLKMIGITVANNALDMEACAKHGIIVSKTDGPLGQGTWAAAELTLGLLISAFRNFPDAFANMKLGKFQEGLPVGRTLAGRTLGVIGFGRLGKRVAEYAIALGMQVIAWSPHLDRDVAAGSGVKAVSKDDVLRQADAISVHVKLSETSRGLIGVREIALMKPGALLINTSRGPIVDEAALLTALGEGRIRAALDVFDDEPLPPDHPLRSIPNTTLTPHLGFVVEESWARYYPQSVENALAFLDGHPLRTIVPTGA